MWEGGGGGGASSSSPFCDRKGQPVFEWPLMSFWSVLCADAHLRSAILRPHLFLHVCFLLTPAWLYLLAASYAREFLETAPIFGVAQKQGPFRMVYGLRSVICNTPPNRAHAVGVSLTTCTSQCDALLILGHQCPLAPLPVCRAQSIRLPDHSKNALERLTHRRRRGIPTPFFALDGACVWLARPGG